MPGITAEDLIDLDRWYSIQFACRDAATAAVERYRRYRARTWNAAAAHWEATRAQSQHDDENTQDLAA